MKGLVVLMGVWLPNPDLPSPGKFQVKHKQKYLGLFDTLAQERASYEAAVVEREGAGS